MNIMMHINAGKKQKAKTTGVLEEFTRAAPDTRIHRYFMLVLTRPSGQVGAFE